jgi:Plasmid replication region DNA-binding N-term
VSTSPAAYGTTRERGATVSYSDVERAARALMTAGERPTVKAVLKTLGRGSPNHITSCMQRFWKDQSALNAGDPVALTRVPPELAESARALWEQALRLSQQTAQHDDTAARARLDELRRDISARAHSQELREREWDMAARLRERALTDAREQVNLLMKELVLNRAELRARDTRIADLENQLEEHRRQLTTVIARAISKSRAAATRKPPVTARAKPKKGTAARKKRPRTPQKPLHSKRKRHG